MKHFIIHNIQKSTSRGFCIFVVLSVLSSSCFSQSFFSKLLNQDGSKRKSLYERHSDISFGVGTSNYYGDLVVFSRPIQSTLQNINWNLSLEYTRHFNSHFSGRVGFTWARISGDDNKYEGVANFEQLYMRNLHFRNDVKELAVTGIYNLVAESRSYRNRAKIIPYLFAGIAVFHHSPEAKAPKDYGGTEVSPGEWVSLQPLNTEGQGLPNYPDQSYNLITVSVPFGAGLKYKLNRNWDLGFEAGIRYTFTDYLDDVGGKIADRTDLQTGISSLAASMAHRENEKIAVLTGRDREATARNFYLSQGSAYAYLNNINLFPPNTFPELDETNGGVRNSSAKLNDVYMVTSFKIIYHIPPSIKCPVVR